MSAKQRPPVLAAEGHIEIASGRRGIATRHAIDRAATDLFYRLGFHATTMRMIGNAANVQPAAIYHWYPNKEALLVHLQDEFMRGLTEVVQPAVERQPGGVRRLAAAVWEHVRFHALHQQEAFVTDSEIRALSQGPREELIRKRDAYQGYFQDMILSGIAEGGLAPVNARIATYAILLQCTGVALWFKSSGALSPEEVADCHVDLVLGSLHAPRTVIDDAIASLKAHAVPADH